MRDKTTFRLIAWAGVFLAICAAAMTGWTSELDRFGVLALRDQSGLASSGMAVAARAVTALGDTAMIVVVALGGAAGLAAMGRRREAIILVAATALGMAASDLAKALFDRPRPDIVGHLVEVSSASLPSGHATRAVATYLTLATLASRRALILGLAVSIVGLVGASRIYLGVHWPSDVLAGWALGGACGLAAEMMLRGRSTKS